MSTPRDAVQLALSLIDQANPQQPISISAQARTLIDKVLDNPRNYSDRVALLFFLAYKKLAPGWDCRSVPSGWRPADKVLAAGLTDRHLRLHGNITSPGENMGIKGQASGFDLFSRPILGAALGYTQRHPGEVDELLRYVAQRFRSSFQPAPTIATPGPDELVFSGANRIANDLIFADSGGHFPQFLVAALLRARFEQWEVHNTVATYHPNQSDTSGRVAGDVEVRDSASVLVDAYEVTVRPDWKNRRPDLIKKMSKHGLSRYNLICLIDADDPDIGTPNALHAYMSELGQDIAVVDIRAFAATSLQDLDREHRRSAFRYVSDYVLDDRLCGIPQLADKLKGILDS